MKKFDKYQKFQILIIVVVAMASFGFFSFLGSESIGRLATCTEGDPTQWTFGKACEQNLPMCQSNSDCGACQDCETGTGRCFMRCASELCVREACSDGSVHGRCPGEVSTCPPAVY